MKEEEEEETKTKKKHERRNLKFDDVEQMIQFPFRMNYPSKNYRPEIMLKTLSCFERELTKNNCFSIRMQNEKEEQKKI